MNITGFYRLGLEAIIAPGDSALPYTSAGRAALPDTLRTLVPANVTSFHYWQKDNPSGTIVFDTFPLVEIDGVTQRNVNGEALNFTHFCGILIRIETIDPGSAAEGDCTVSITSLMGATLSGLVLTSGDFAMIDSATAVAVGVSTALSLAFDGMDNKRATVVLLGREAAAGTYS